MVPYLAVGRSDFHPGVRRTLLVSYAVGTAELDSPVPVWRRAPVADPPRDLETTSKTLCRTAPVRLTPTCQVHPDKPRPDYKTGGLHRTPTFGDRCSTNLSYGPLYDWLRSCTD